MALQLNRKSGFMVNNNFLMLNWNFHFIIIIGNNRQYIDENINNKRKNPIRTNTQHNTSKTIMKIAKHHANYTWKISETVNSENVALARKLNAQTVWIRNFARICANVVYIEEYQSFYCCLDNELRNHALSNCFWLHYDYRVANCSIKGRFSKVFLRQLRHNLTRLGSKPENCEVDRLWF